MPRSNWKETRLGDLISITHGFAFPGKNITDLETDLILATPAHFNIGGGFKNVHKKFFNGDVNEEYILKEGDLIITMTDLSKEGDTLGYSAIVPKLKNKKLLHNQRIGKVKINNPDIEKNFLNYLLRDKHYRHWVLSTSTGSTVRHTSPKRIQEFKFFLPSIEEQSNIAEILLTLDGKIELNQHMNKNLEDIAKTLFKSWFIDFDPVKAKAEGRPTGLSKEIDDLFPDTFQNSELGEIPNNYEVGKLEKMARYLNRGVSPTYVENSGVYLVNQKCIRNGQIDFNLCKQSKEKSSMNERYLEKYDILLNSMGVGTLGRVAMFHKFDTKITADALVTIIKSHSIGSSFFIYYFLERLEDYLNTISVGSTGQTSLKKEDILNLQMIIPPKKLLDEFGSQLSLYAEKKYINTQENLILTDLRDTLLPKLISGELKVQDAVNLIEEANIL